MEAVGYGALSCRIMCARGEASDLELTQRRWMYVPTAAKYLVNGMSQSWNQCLEPDASKMGYPGMDIHLSSLVVFFHCRRASQPEDSINAVAPFGISQWPPTLMPERLLKYSACSNIICHNADTRPAAVVCPGRTVKQQSWKLSATQYRRHRPSPTRQQCAPLRSASALRSTASCNTWPNSP